MSEAFSFSNIFADIADQSLFYMISFVIIISALMVVSLRNIFHCALFLILCLFSVAGIYFMLEAEFLAAVQILIYVGAVSILIIFAIMLTSQIDSKSKIQSNEQVTVGLVVSASFILATLAAFPNTVWNVKEAAMPVDNIMTIGKLLMTDFVLPFEVVSVVLLAAMIGAIVLARREKS